MKILLAEDDKNFGSVLKTELEEDRYAVDLVTNGVEAVLNFIEQPYILVLLDIRMPRLSGTDALKIIKRLNPRIPVITFSGNATSPEVTESLACGAATCLMKPFKVQQLKDDIKRVIC